MSSTTTSVGSSSATGIAQKSVTIETTQRIPVVEAVHKFALQMYCEKQEYVTTKQLVQHFGVAKSILNKRREGTPWIGLYGMVKQGYLRRGPEAATWVWSDPFAHEESIDDEDDVPIGTRRARSAQQESNLPPSKRQAIEIIDDTDDDSDDVFE